jgi:hypothetical protein
MWNDVRSPVLTGSSKQWSVTINEAVGSSSTGLTPTDVSRIGELRAQRESEGNFAVAAQPIHRVRSKRFAELKAEARSITTKGDTVLFEVAKNAKELARYRWIKGIGLAGITVTHDEADTAVVNYHRTANSSLLGGFDVSTVARINGKTVRSVVKLEAMGGSSR